MLIFFFSAAGLKEREERAARKAAKKAEKAQQAEAAANQSHAAPPNTQFFSQLPSSAAPLFTAPDFTDTRVSSPAAPAFHGSNLTLPPRNMGWNTNQFGGPQSSPGPSMTSNEMQPWNQHHALQSSPMSSVSNLPGSQNFMGTSKFKSIFFFWIVLILWQIRATAKICIASLMI